MQLGLIFYLACGLVLVKNLLVDVGPLLGLMEFELSAK